MAIDFPSSPSVNDTFTSGSLVYTYDGTKWTAQPAGVSGGTKIEVSNTKAEIIDTGSDGRFVVTTEGTGRMTVDSSGRLLVGTSTARTSANGVSAGLQVEGTGADGALSIIRNGGDAYLTLGRSGGGSVGSNTAISNGDGLGRISWAAADGTDIQSWAAQISAEIDGVPGSNDTPGRLVFSTTADGASSPTERMRIRSDGQWYYFSSDTALVLGTSVSAGTSNALIDGRYSGSGVNTGTRSFIVFTNGNVQNTNNSYAGISDIKLKENIVDASSQWNDLKALQVRNYNFKEGQTHTQIGLVAQEVELVSPGLVTESPDRDEEGNDLGTVTKSVNYSVLYMKAVKALQEAITKIETLEAKVAALES